MTQPAGTLVVDSPWKFGDKLPGPKRGADKHYRTMTVDELKQFQLPPLLPDCRMFFWRVAAMQYEALDIIRHWGFTLKSELVWIKVTKTGKPHWGMGWQFRLGHEVCLVATRGRPPRLSAGILSWFIAPVGVHSQKPDKFYKIVDKMSPGPTVELFARRQWEGWTCLGDEMPGIDDDAKDQLMLPGVEP